MTEKEWSSSNDVRNMLWHVTPGATERKLVLYVAACCRRIAGMLTDSRPLKAVEVAERVPEGLAAPEELRQASADAGIAWVNAMFAAEGVSTEGFANKYQSPDYNRARRAAYAADAVSQFLNRPELAVDRSTCSARHAAGDESPDALFSVLSTGNPEREIHRRFLDDIFGNPYRPVAFDPRWRTSDAVALAQAIYDDRAFERLPILADALMDAGCEDEQVVGHCRNEGPHVCGCWVVDLVLGKDWGSLSD
jgi:hypothetical protein